MMNNIDLYEEVIIAGFGGQGIILAGKLLAQAAMVNGYEVTYMPSYGAEVRGGTANCMVVIADELIASPLVNCPGALITLNKASYSKFTPHLRPGGLLVVNSSKITERQQGDDVEIIAIPADDIAAELNSPKSANMVALGAYLQRRGLIEPAMAAECLREVLAKRYHKSVSVNREAILRGAEFAKDA